MARKKPWHRNPKERLYRNYFYFHFTNHLTPKYRNGCYLCYQVEKIQPCSSTLVKGVFENQFYPKKPLHTELCFLNWFHDMTLSPVVNYRVTWYITWSPCAHCAEEVADFLRENRNVSLTIRAARLYYSKKPEFQQGLRRLDLAGATVAVMSPEDFSFCWENFVDHEGEPFEPWANIDENSQSLSETLENILNEN